MTSSESSSMTEWKTLTNRSPSKLKQFKNMSFGPQVCWKTNKNLLKEQETIKFVFTQSKEKTMNCKKSHINSPKIQSLLMVFTHP